MNTKVSDILLLLLAIRRWANAAAEASTLIQKMRAEGRDYLTDEEKASLRLDDDEARQKLVDVLGG